MASVNIAVVAVALALIGSSLGTPLICPHGQLGSGEAIQFRWSIHNFSMRAEQVNEHMSSPLFPVDADASTPKWLLRLAPVGNQDHVSLYLCLDPNQKDVHLADYHFRVLANDYSTTKNVYSIRSETPRQFPDEKGHCWGHSKFLPRSSLSNYLWDDDTLHILCDIQVRHESQCASAPDGFFDQKVSNPLAYTYWCDTHYKTVEVLSSTWDIQDVTQNWGENKTIDSPPIKGSELPLVEWETDFRMRMVEHDESGDNERYAGLYVCLLSSKQEGDVLATNRITVLAHETANNRIFTTPKVRRHSLSQHNPPISGPCWGWERALSYSAIEDLLQDDVLYAISEVTRITEVTACSKDLPSITQTCLTPPEDEDTDTLKVNKISTVVPTEFLKPTGAAPFPPNVLFLYAILDNDQNGSQEDDQKASIDALGAYAFRGDTNPKSVGIVSDLLVLGHKNQLEDLKKVCEKILFDKITVESTIRILQAADEANSMELKEKAFQFLIANKDPVLATEDFEKLRNTEHPLYIEITWRILNV